MEPDNPRLDDFVLGLAAAARPRVCFLATASGDADSYLVRFYQAFAGRAEPTHLPLFPRVVGDLTGFLCAQHIVYVGGGNTVSMIGAWRAHGLDLALRAAWEAGVILAGVSAGSFCWFECGVTDSLGEGLAPWHGGLGFLPGSHCPHYDGEPLRRPAYHQAIADGMPPGYAVDDGAALHFCGTGLAEVVSSHDAARAYRVERAGDTVRETILPTRHLG
jgi:peptidase E